MNQKYVETTTYIKDTSAKKIQIYLHDPFGPWNLQGTSDLSME